MPRYQFTCSCCGASFDVARGNSTPLDVICPVHGSDASLTAIFGDGLYLNAPRRTSPGTTRVVISASTIEEHTHPGTPEH